MKKGGMFLLVALPLAAAFAFSNSKKESCCTSDPNCCDVNACCQDGQTSSCCEIGNH